MGEIGIERNTLMYQMRWWEIRAVMRGYRRRQRPLWEALRWHVLHIINMFAKDQITSVRRLCTFYWEREETETDQPTDDEIAQLQEEMRRMNENNGFQQ